MDNDFYEISMLKMDLSTNLNASNTSAETCPEINQDLIIFRIIIYVFLGSFICLVGFIGNTLSIIVLRRQGQEEYHNMAATSISRSRHCRQLSLIPTGGQHSNGYTHGPDLMFGLLLPLYRQPPIGLCC